MALADTAPMSFFLILFLIVVSRFGSKPKKHKSKKTLRCICVIWGVGRNLEYHTYLEGWSSFLILSCLSIFPTRVDAHSQQNLFELQELLQSFNVQTIFNLSKALLYAPVFNESCTKKLMYCYLLELDVVLQEENFEDRQMVGFLEKQYNNSRDCPCVRCETFTPVDAPTFLTKMEDFIQQLHSLGLKRNTDLCS